jgi:rRNA maturation protein Nop10
MFGITNLLLLHCLVYKESGTKSCLLSDLLGFDSTSELRREGDVCKRHIVEDNVESPGTVLQPLPNHLGHLGNVSKSAWKMRKCRNTNLFTLSDQLTGVELRHYALQDLVDNGGQNTLVIVGANLAVNLWKGSCVWP